MEPFDEPSFIWALMHRTEDAKQFRTVFHPSWLQDVTLSPLLATVFEFVEEYGVAPDLETTAKVLRDRDEAVFMVRWNDSIERVRSANPSLAMQLYTLERAKDVAIVRSFQQLAFDPDLGEAQSNFEGGKVLKAINEWVNSFAGNQAEGIQDFKSAIEQLIQGADWNSRGSRIASGVAPIDDWTNGGLRQKQLGIVLAPTGGGKSAILANMALFMSNIELRNVLFYTNELTTEEQTERFLARLKNKDMRVIQENPVVGYDKLDKYWKMGLDQRLRMQAVVGRGANANDIEADMRRYTALNSWKPDVLVLDYMGRMTPNDRRQQDNEWTSMGAIAEDLVTLAKRMNIIIWTAAQTNRAGLAKNASLDMTMGQGSIRHFQEAAAVVSAQKKVVGKIEFIQFQEQKMRHGAMEDRKAAVKSDLSKMFIDNEVMKEIPTVEEQIEVTSTKGSTRPSK